MKKVLLTFALLLIVAGGMFLTQKYLNTEGTLFSFPQKSPIVTINNQTFKVAIASSPEEQQLGLSETETLQPDQGMIFLFKQPAYYSFWMKNMKFPIDIIYINNDTITTIISNAQPAINNAESPIVYTPTEPSDKVLEIQAGLAEKYEFKKGDKVIYENISN